jgi:hypothetical protein
MITKERLVDLARRWEIQSLKHDAAATSGKSMVPEKVAAHDARAQTYDYCATELRTLIVDAYYATSAKDDAAAASPPAKCVHKWMPTSPAASCCMRCGAVAP